MIDLSKISYRVRVTTEEGKLYEIKDFITNLGWEENQKEIAVRTSFTAKNDQTSKGYLSSIIKPGCLIEIFASDGVMSDEVARGYVETWSPVEKNSSNTLKCTCYDELYKLQRSQDNRYYPSGTGTKSAVLGILTDWKIEKGEYQGPNATHGKQIFNNQYLSDIIAQLIDDAEKKGEKKCIIRASKGKANIVPKGSNQDVYVFNVENAQMFGNRVSTTNLITRVKVLGKADDDGQRSVEATLNGLTKFGIRQRIYTRGSDESIEDAKAAAQDILDNEGAIENDMILQSPDVPFVRKGDAVYVVSGTTENFYYVKSIQHNAEQYSMTMELELAKKETVSGENMIEKIKEFKVGDIVNFKGGTHYVSSQAGARGANASPGKAKITIGPNGNAHPWHLIHADGSSNVYGWVDDGSFE